MPEFSGFGGAGKLSRQHHNLYFVMHVIILGVGTRGGLSNKAQV